jgi:tRNA-splicing ligase RtcB
VCSGLERKEVRGHIRKLVETLFRNIPCGVGSKRKDLRLSKAELKKVLLKGVGWAVKKGFGLEEDPEYVEERGCIQGADPDQISDRALERGKAQLGTLGSGNHFVEVGYVDEVYDEHAAKDLGLFLDQVTIIVHTGSRGLGHQVCDDYIKILMKSTQKYGIELPDRQLCCAPIASQEGRQYLAAMAGAANYAFANRQIIFHWVRETFERVFQMSSERLGLRLIYDVCHNIAKIETHRVDGIERKLCVHRKGATRAFPPHHPDTPLAYKDVGQPVLIPGDMGRYSYVLVGTEQAMAETFGSTCHGAGRVMSRKQAMRVSKGRAIIRELEDQGITVRSAGKATVREEIPEAYKDVSQVVEVVSGAGISKKVVRLRPMGVIKG